MTSAYAALADQMVWQVDYFIVGHLLEENLAHLVIREVFRVGFDIHRQ